MTATATLSALVVDDDFLVRQATARALTQKGFACEVAANGIEAMERLHDRQFDITITDLRMPEMNGHNLVVEMLAMAARPAIVVLTGVAQPRLVRDLIARGVEDVVAKPADYDLLSTKALALAERRRALRQPTGSGFRHSDSLELTAGLTIIPGAGVETTRPMPATRNADADSVKQGGKTASPVSEHRSSVREGQTDCGHTPATPTGLGQSTHEKTLSGSAPATSETAKQEQVAGHVKVVLSGLSVPPADFDAFRVTSSNAFGIKELTEAVLVRPAMVGEVLLLANCALFRAIEQSDSKQRSPEPQEVTEHDYGYILCIGSLVLGLLIGVLVARVLG